MSEPAKGLFPHSWRLVAAVCAAILSAIDVNLFWRAFFAGFSVLELWWYVEWRMWLKGEGR